MCRPNLTQHLIGYDNFVFLKCGFAIVSHSEPAAQNTLRKVMMATVEKGFSDY